jgi:hypothetical protein
MSPELTEENELALAKAEKAIQKILLDLENEYPVVVERVWVDVRRFQNLAVSIEYRMLEERQ